ncbi:MAG: thiamine pyrophosphate-binding protein [Deinococcales bacterium]
MAKVRMTPSEAFVEQLAAEGIDTIWGIVGSAFKDALDIFPKAGIRFISVAHEQAAAHAADAMARVTGRPQACIAQNVPPHCQLCLSHRRCLLYPHSPVVCITPEAGTSGIGLGGFQELDQMPMFEKQTVFQVSASSRPHGPNLMRQCFHMAKVENDFPPNSTSPVISLRRSRL